MRTAVAEPRELAAAWEHDATVPAGRYEEGFSGYGVMGLPFSSGHVLALRRFPATSVGPAYTSIWHRDPSGRWVFRQDAPADLACPRYFSAAAAESIHTKIDMTWTGPRAFAVTADSLQWQVQLRATGVTRMMNAAAGRLSPRVWSDPRVLSAMGRVAGGVMRAGHVGLQGAVPNGQSFQAHPLRVWMVEGSTATLDGSDLGLPGALAEQAHLGEACSPSAAHSSKRSTPTVMSTSRTAPEELERDRPCLPSANAAQRLVDAGVCYPGSPMHRPDIRTWSADDRRAGGYW